MPAPPSRDRYADVGAAQRESIRRLLTSDAKVNALTRVFLAVHHLLPSYSRVADHVYVAQVAAVAGVHRDTAAKMLKRLHRLGVLEWHPTRGRGRASSVSLPGGAKTRPLLDVLSGERRSQTGRKPGQLGLENTAACGRAPEEVPEKNDVDDELDELLRPLGHATSTQRRELAAALRESPAGFRQSVADARRGDRPIGLLLTLVREGAHRTVQLRAEPPAAKAERWIRTAGHLLVREDLELELVHRGLDEGDRARLLELADDCRRAATEAKSA